MCVVWYGSTSKTDTIKYSTLSWLLFEWFWMILQGWNLSDATKATNIPSINAFMVWIRMYDRWMCIVQCITTHYTLITSPGYCCFVFGSFHPPSRHINTSLTPVIGRLLRGVVGTPCGHFVSSSKVTIFSRGFIGAIVDWAELIECICCCCCCCCWCCCYCVLSWSPYFLNFHFKATRVKYSRRRFSFLPIECGTVLRSPKDTEIWRWTVVFRAMRK